MEFLVYTAEPLEVNSSLANLEHGEDKDIARMIWLLEDMDLERVLMNGSVELLVNNVQYENETNITTATIYKQTSPKKAIHQVANDGDGVTVQEILSEHEDAFLQGRLGMKKVDGEIYMLIEKSFGSYFGSAAKGVKLRSEFSSDTVQAIQDSETIGRTMLKFADDYDLSAALVKPPEDENVREEDGLGGTNMMNRLISVLNISNAHRISLDIDRDKWLENIEVFNDLIKSGIVTTIVVKGTKDNRVKLGEGGDRAIRKTIETIPSSTRPFTSAFAQLPE